MNEIDARSSVLVFLSRAFPGHRFGEEEDIFKLGFVSSLFAMQLVEFVEREFGIVVETDDLDVVNFQSVGAIARFAVSKVAATSRPAPPPDPCSEGHFAAAEEVPR
jgi:acyl carrier protein